MHLVSDMPCFVWLLLLHSIPMILSIATEDDYCRISQQHTLCTNKVRPSKVTMQGVGKVTPSKVTMIIGNNAGCG